MWRDLTESDILTVLNAAETAAYKMAVTGPGQNVIADTITRAVNLCRGYIGDNRENRLAEGETLPERVHLPALHIIRVELLTRLDLEVSEDRARARTEAIRFFEGLAAGRFQVEQPEGPVDASGTMQSITLLSNNERQATRQNLSGL